MNVKIRVLIVSTMAVALPVVLATPSEAATIGSRALVIAGNQVNDPYQYGASGPNRFDCSGLTQYAFKSVGKQLPRTAAQQLNATTPVSASQRQPGDLVFFGSPVYHVGIYAGGGKIWNANTGSYRGRRVVLAPISEYGGTVRYGRVR